jgi:hypothetical protein
MASIISDYTSKLPSGKNIITQTLGNNTVQPFTIQMGKVVITVKTPSMPARLEVKQSLTDGKFSPDKSKAKNYYAWLNDGILPGQELAYITGYLYLSQLCGNGLSLVSGVRATMLEKILKSIPDNLEIYIKTAVNNGGNDLEIQYNRDDIESLVRATLPRSESLNAENRKHAKNATAKPAEVKDFKEVEVW